MGIGKDRWGNRRDWEYIGDVDVRHGGIFYDLAAADDYGGERPTDPEALSDWIRCGVDSLLAVEAIDMGDHGLDGAIRVARGTVYLPDEIGRLRSALSSAGVEIDELPDDPRQRLSEVADAVRHYVGIEEDLLETFQLGRKGRLRRRHAKADHRIREGVDVEEFLRREWLAMGEPMPEAEWKEAGVVVVHDRPWLAPGWTEVETEAVRFAYDRHEARVVAAEYRAPDAPCWTPCDDALKEALADDLRGLDWAAVIDRPEEHEGVEVAEGFDGFPAPPGPRP